MQPLPVSLHAVWVNWVPFALVVYSDVPPTETTVPRFCGQPLYLPSAALSPADATIATPLWFSAFAGSPVVMESSVLNWKLMLTALAPRPIAVVTALAKSLAAVSASVWVAVEPSASGTWTSIRWQAGQAALAMSMSKVVSKPSCSSVCLSGTVDAGASGGPPR